MVVLGGDGDVGRAVARATAGVETSVGRKRRLPWRRRTSGGGSGGNSWVADGQAGTKIEANCYMVIPKASIDVTRQADTFAAFKEVVSMSQLAVYYEHPDWFRPVFAALERRGIPFTRLDAGAHIFDLDEKKPAYDLVFNRASPSGYLRGHLGTIFSTWSWLSHLERLGVQVVNGSRVFAHEISKSRQLTALEELGIAYPRARAINNPSVAVAASRGLRFPIVVKANVGGSGAGITRFDSEDELAAAVASGSLNLGIDGTALV